MWTISSTSSTGQTVPFDGGHAVGSMPSSSESAGDNDFFADPARDELGDQGVETTAQLVAPPGQVTVMLDQQTAHRRVVLGSHRGQHRGVQRGDRRPTGRRWGRSWSTGPTLSTRTRDANVAGTSTTFSPTATSCWANR